MSQGRDGRSMPSQSKPHNQRRIKTTRAMNAVQSTKSKSKQIDQTRIRNQIQMDRPNLNPNPNSNGSTGPESKSKSEQTMFIFETCNQRRLKAKRHGDERRVRRTEMAMRAISNDDQVRRIFAPCQCLDRHDHLWLKILYDVYNLDN